jgi:hypothetical protein
VLPSSIVTPTEAAVAVVRVVGSIRLIVPETGPCCTVYVVTPVSVDSVAFPYEVNALIPAV